ncbi:MAG TPA: hypothetical protein VML94_02250 [Thermoplasmata archaeon]|nr:hypothetical protein [Thermoplasmata archaeon]
MRRWISERHTLKVLIEPRGVVVGVTMKRYSILFFLTRAFLGVRRVRTADRVVARAGYSAPATLALIRELYPTGVPPPPDAAGSPPDG